MTYKLISILFHFSLIGLSNLGARDVQCTCGEPDEIVAGELRERDVPSQGHPVNLGLLCGLNDHAMLSDGNIF